MLESVTPVGASLIVFYLVGILLTLYVLDDIIRQQDQMEPMEQLFWIGTAVLLNLIGAAVYLAVVRYGDGPIIADGEDGADSGTRDTEEGPDE